MRLTGYKAIKNELGDSDMPVSLGKEKLEGDLPLPSEPGDPSTKIGVGERRPVTNIRGYSRKVPLSPLSAQELLAREGATGREMRIDVKKKRKKMAARNKADTSKLIVNEDFGTSALVYGHHQFGRGHFSTAALRDLATRLKIHPVVVLLEFASGWITDTVVDPNTGEVKVVRRPVVDDLRLLGAKEAAKYLSPQLKSVEIRDGSKEQKDLANVMMLAHAHSAASRLEPGEEVVVIQGEDRSVVHTGSTKMIDEDLPPGRIPDELQEGLDDDDEPTGESAA
jgi:hypothetical protein